MIARGDAPCPACGAPLPAPAGGVAVVCPWCGAQAQLGAVPAARELLLADRGDRAEAAALLTQHLAARCRAPATVRGGGEARLAPFWSIVTAGGDLLTGPATREQAPLLRRVAIPAVPACPLTEGETLPVARCAADVPLAEFLASVRAGGGATADDVERAWLLWVPVRFWQVRAGGRLTGAVTVADTTQVVVAALTGPDTPPALRAGAIAPLVAFTACLLLLGRLLPLAWHVPAAAVLCAAALWAWRRPPDRDEATAPATPARGGPDTPSDGREAQP